MKLERYAVKHVPLSYTKHANGPMYKVAHVDEMLNKLHAFAQSDKCGTDEADAIWEIIGSDRESTL